MSSPTRRDFLKFMGLGTAWSAVGRLPLMAGPFQAGDFEPTVPADKKLHPEWVRSLFERGERTVYRGADLEKIGMPVGGICTGQLYLGGDGRLWHWDIFNEAGDRTGGLYTGQHYVQPMAPESPIDQGFALRLRFAGTAQVRALDRTGFSQIAFQGEYPIGVVEYRHEASPVAVSLEAFSPFIPLNAADSHLPATILSFTIKNTSAVRVEGELAGWLENAVCLQSAKQALGARQNRIARRGDLLLLVASAAPAPAPQAAPPEVFADFEGGSYGAWKVEGDAFGKAPAPGAPNPVQRLSGFLGKGLANSWPASDEPTGRLLSPEFVIRRPFISFLIGGGDHPGETCIDLIVEEKVARTATGRNTDAMEWVNWEVGDLKGKTGRLEIADRHGGGWGHIDIDQIEFGDAPRSSIARLDEQPDFGTLALALLEARESDLASPSIAAAGRPEGVFAPEGLSQDGEGEKPFGEKLRGALARGFALEPGEEARAVFLVAWHFPNLRLDPLPGGRFYATRFASAEEVAEHIARNFDRLAGETRLWRDTWYDSTLPCWFLDRTFLNTSILATTTAMWFRNGRFYGWEGVNCCPGTCTHVWHYGQALGRIFPELERSLRELADFGVSFDPKTGVVDHRGEFRAGVAFDGQAGTILRAYRDHQMSPDEAFLRRNWEKIKKALDYLIERDGDGDGILEGPQHNTLDAAWFGRIAWLSSLYLAALRAGEEMARELGDGEFAARARSIFEAGRKKIAAELFNGEYFYQKRDPKNPDTLGSYDGCEIDQVFGQSWAFQVGLGRILDADPVRSALRSLWKYNFTPDVGPFRKANPSGRWYAVAGEAGLLMCTFPKGGREAMGRGNPTFAGYFNECMTGFEYQVAGHMIWEGMTLEGLAIARAIHDRYHPSRRNPWNEIECGDHYARAMASYGVFIAACGYEHHGPKGHLGFAPRLAPEDFRAAFTAAEGWGSFAQKREGGTQRELIEVKWGKLRLRTLAFEVKEGFRPQKVTVALAGQPVGCAHGQAGNRIRIQLSSEVILTPGEALESVLA
ncbi:MAG: twin-arginine translocation signal domain-containing protein [Planctomycetes bacterium]|nr:twin-arginine translocation signal domain-containing protein [Planctomycetota bacterium]